MTGRERIMAALSGRDMDKVPLTEFGIWPETLERWYTEGYPVGVHPSDYFGFDKIHFFSFDGTLGLKERAISSDETTRTYSDKDGCMYKQFIGRQTPPQYLGSIVKEMDDWVNLRDNLIPDFARFKDYHEDFIFMRHNDEDQLEKYDLAVAANEFRVLVPTEACWYYLRLLGEETALMNIMMEPELFAQILEDYNAFTLNMVRTILSRGYKFDAMMVFSDLTYGKGMLFSPKIYREFVLPHQQKLFALAKENGMKVIYHSDGKVHEFVPLLIEAGIDCIQPLEARAGNDVNHYLNLYPSLSCMGNINMDMFAKDKESIEKEIMSKLIPAKETKRYIFHSDHSVPYTVSFENYSYGIELAKKHACY